MNIRMRGEGKVTDKNDAISYGAGAEKDPMADLVEQEDQGGEKKAAEQSEEVSTDGPGIEEESIQNTDDIASTLSDDQTAPKIIDSTEATVEELLPESNRPGFDDREIQDARNDFDVEGGVTKPQTTGPMKLPSGDVAQEGGQIKHGHLADSAQDAYEVSGFHVEVPTGTGMVSQQITQNFVDLETAKASINGEMFLRPQQGGFKACKIIRGAPIICYNERQILEYIDGKWRRP